MTNRPLPSSPSVLEDLRARRAVALHHVEIHRSGELVAEADIAEVPDSSVAAALHTSTLCRVDGVEAALVDEVDAACDAVAGSSALLELPGGATEMLARVVEVYDAVEVHRDGDLVIATGTVPEHHR